MYKVLVQWKFSGHCGKKLLSTMEKIYDCGQIFGTVRIFVVIVVGITLPAWANIYTAPWENFMVNVGNHGNYLGSHCGKNFASYKGL